MLDDVEWGEFRLGDLFEIQNTLSFNKEVLNDGTEYDYVTRTSQNQGILQETGFVNQENINPSGTWSLGLLQMDFFYRRKPWYAGQFVRKIVPKEKLTESAILYFTTVLNKQKKHLLKVLVRHVDDTFRESKVFLPTKNGEIDYDFMERFVAELEAARVAELEAYLTATGLKDYTLSAEEQQVLEAMEQGRMKWGEFNLEALFGKSTRGKRLKSADRIDGDLPFVTAGEANEGVSAWIGNDVTVFSENTVTIDMFGSAKYRNYKYGADDHVAVVHTEHLPKAAAVFMAAAIHKASYTGEFHYGRNFYAKDADALNIKLPTKNGKIDYTTMQTLISAVQKLVIKDVVLYTDKKISATQSLVAKT